MVWRHRRREISLNPLEASRSVTSRGSLEQSWEGDGCEVGGGVVGEGVGDGVGAGGEGGWLGGEVGGIVDGDELGGWTGG